MPGGSPLGIFLSYRREDTMPHARFLQFQLRERFPDEEVFMDLDSIEAGLDFAEVIEEKVDSCMVLVALIGRQWATLADDEGNRRLDNPDDFVRFEVKAALEHGVRVIPVLVDGARPLRRQELPAELHKLARLNALEWSSRRYQYDADQLLDLIEKVLAPIREREEADRQAREEAARKAQEEEAARLAQEEAARKEAERKARQAEQRRARRAAQRLAQEEAARKAQEEEAERLAREKEAKRKKAERKKAERKARKKAERKEAEQKAFQAHLKQLNEQLEAERQRKLEDPEYLEKMRAEMLRNVAKNFRA